MTDREKLTRHIATFTRQVELARRGAIDTTSDSSEFRTWLNLRLRLDGMLEAVRILTEED